MKLLLALRGIGVAVVLACVGAAASWSPETPVRHHRVDIRGLTFQPRELHVASGDIVSWVNHDIVSHTVTAADSRWDSGEIPSGDTFARVVEGSSARPYICRYHPTMAGMLIVR